ncbi:hypothetical protein GC207_06800 [bacterium]|nr:hypothetical protein [bacterium]
MADSSPNTRHPLDQIPELLAARAETVRAWLTEPLTRRLGVQVAIIVLGAGVYGATLGLWRSPLQALFVAIKFPLILLLTTTFNALLNGMLAQLLGLQVRFMDSFRLILMSFATAALILASFSPLTLFALWNAPPLADASAAASDVYSGILLMHVLAIATAGVAANIKLLQTVKSLSGDTVRARLVLFSWLAGNLFLGSQFVWNLRPFIGAPYLPVEFFRPTAFQGNFFEAVLVALRHLFTS